MAAYGSSSFQYKTELFLHNVRYFPAVVTRQHIHEFVFMLHDPDLLAEVADQLALLRDDL